MVLENIRVLTNKFAIYIQNSKLVFRKIATYKRFFPTEADLILFITRTFWCDRDMSVKPICVVSNKCAPWAFGFVYFNKPAKSTTPLCAIIVHHEDRLPDIGIKIKFPIGLACFAWFCFTQRSVFGFTLKCVIVVFLSRFYVHYRWVNTRLFVETSGY